MPLANGQVDLLPPTMENVCAYEPGHIANLAWLSDNELLFSRKAPGESWRIQALNLGDDQPRTVAIGRNPVLDWSRRTAAFEQNGKYFVLDIAGTRTRALIGCAADAYVNEWQWSRDGRTIAYLRLRMDARTHDAASRALNDFGAVEYIDVGKRFLALPRSGSELCLEELETGRITSIAIEGRCRGLTWSPDGRVLLRRYRHMDYEEAPFESQVLEINPASEEVEEIFSVPGRMQSLVPRPSPDGKLLALGFDADAQCWVDFVSLHVLDRESRVLRRLTKDAYVCGYQWMPDGKSLIVRVRQGGLTQLYLIGLEGKTKQLTDAALHHHGEAISPDGKRIAYITVDLYGRCDLRAREIDQSASERVLLTVDDPTQTFDLPEAQPIRYTSYDGTQVCGFLVKPTKFDASRKHPACVDVHGGGPGSSLTLDGNMFPTLLERFAWASLGYVVLSADYRSSGEYGPQIAKDMYRNHDYMGYDADWRDIAAAGAYLSDLDYVDASRIALYGVSAGGVRVRRVVTETNMFAAAAAIEGNPSGAIAEIIMQCSGEFAGRKPSDPLARAYCGGSIEDAPQRYAGGFLLDGWKAKTPTLLVSGNPAHGAFPLLSNELFFSCMRGAGVQARFLIYPSEGHGFRLAAALHIFEQMNSWFDEHLSLRRNSDGDLVWNGSSGTPLQEV